MSFLHTVTADQCRAEELRNAWNSLTFDFYKKQHQSTPSIYQRQILTPPLTPDSIGYQSRHSSVSSYTTTPDFFDGRSSRSEQTSHILDHRTDHLYPTMDSIRCGLLDSTSQCSCCPSMPPTLLPAGSEIYDRNSLSYQNRRHSVAQIRKTIENRQNMMVPMETTFDINNINTSNSLKRKIQGGDNIDMPKKSKRDDEVACQVHGILSLPGCREPRYNITVNELTRRVNQPECLTKVDMISYVRLAKNSARSLLDKHHIKTNQHNQRSEHTVLSKMCESEAQVLAKGIREINYRYFPGSWFARKSVEEISNNSANERQQREAFMERLKEDEVTKCVLLDIYFGMEKRREDKEMNIFNLMSHSFGVPNLQNHILFILSYIEEELRILRKHVN